MKKTFILFLSVVLTMTGCQKNGSLDVVEPEGVIGATSAFILEDGPDATKTSLTYNGTSLDFAWKLDDKLAVFGAAGKDQQIKLSVKDKDGQELSASANFNITLDYGLTPDNEYVAYYPVKDNSIELTADRVPFNMTGQVQEGNPSSEYNTKHIGDYDYICSLPTTPIDNNKALFKFPHLVSIVRIAITNVPAGIYGGVALSVADKDTKAFTLSGTCNIFSQSDVEYSGGSPSGVTVDYTATNTSYENTVLFKEAAKVSRNSTMYVWMAMWPTDLSQKELKVNLLGTDYSVAATLDVPHHKTSGVEDYPGRNFKPGHEYHLSIALEEAPEHTWVDLGLPTGTLWATTNVGAEFSTDTGGYYAWGNTTPGYITTSTSYWTNNNELDAAHDPATSWGTDWRTPTSDEWNELIVNCTIVKSSDNTYYTVTSKINGQKMFLPMANWYSGKNIDTAGKNKYLIKDQKTQMSTTFANISNDLSYIMTLTGSYPVRPVRVKKTPAMVDLGLPDGVLWATANIGAICDGSEYNKKDFVQGGLYAWGSVSAGKTATWANYPHTSGGGTGTTSSVTGTFIKYYSGDTYRVLQPEDDIATQTYGEGWCIPTKEDWDNLFSSQYCTTERNTTGYYVKVTSKTNGNYIILPTNTSGSNVYWSSTMGDDEKVAYEYIQTMNNTIPSPKVQTTEKKGTLMIRPVYKPQ